MFSYVYKLTVGMFSYVYKLIAALTSGGSVGSANNNNQLPPDTNENDADAENANDRLPQDANEPDADTEVSMASDCRETIFHILCLHTNKTSHVQVFPSSFFRSITTACNFGKPLPETSCLS